MTGFPTSQPSTRAPLSVPPSPDGVMTVGYLSVSCLSSCSLLDATLPLADVCHFFQVPLPEKPSATLAY